MPEPTDPHSRPSGSSDGDVVYSSGANHRRYREFASHLVPRSGKGKLLLAAFLALFLLAEWPLLSLVNRVEPTWFGVPFLFAYLLMVYVLLIAVLIASAYFEL